MNILFEEHQKLLLILLKYEVSFILIGGYAVIYYGYERTTGDMDIWLRPDDDNKIKLIAALSDYGIKKSDRELIERADFTIAQMFYIGEKPRRMDFLTKVNSVTFDEAILKVNHFPLEEKNVPVIQYHHLILTKITTGRAKDKADVEELQRINKYRKDKPK